jgi:hypothetical protein
MNSNYKKFFSHDSDINFSDYLKNKSGVEILKNLQSKKTNTINYFLSYEDFILFTKTYFNYLYLETPCGQIPTSLYDSNTSFIVYEKMLSHMKDCNKCRFAKDILHLYDCQELIGILYPYGEYIETNLSSSNIHLHSKINLKDFYKNTKNIKQNCKSCANNEVELENTKNIYPSQNNFILEDFINTDKFQQHLRMNAYAVYPNLKYDTSQKNTVDKDTDDKDKEIPLKEEFIQKNTNFEYNSFSDKDYSDKDYSNKNYSENKNSLNNRPIYNTCMKLNKSYSNENENINKKKTIIPLKKNAKYN